jgi:hypothetical protein
VSHSSSISDSSFILLTSRGTCIDNISGKLNMSWGRMLTESLGGRVTHEREKLENTSSTILRCVSFSWICPSLLFEGLYIVLKSMSH